MNDTPTTTTLPSEEDMNKVRGIFEQGLNSILALSKIAVDLKDLQAQFSDLKAEMEFVRSRNRELDQALADVRTQRDTAIRERDEAKAELDTVRHQVEMAGANAREAQQTIESLRADLASAKAERDQAYDAWHKAEAAADDAKTKLADIQEFSRRMFPTTPTAVLTPAPQPEPYSANEEPSKLEPWKAW